jgi:hypothetical protein
MNNYFTKSYHPIIGIAGAARSGKDTLCNGLIRQFSLLGINARRKSIGGDIIKNDLKNILLEKCQIDPFLLKNDEEKELIRPILVEYGRLQRHITKGQYFINKFEEKNNNSVLIIPDIRYAEYENDEIFWLKNKKNGLLIFIERENVFDANEAEKSNNKKIKDASDYILKWDTLNANNPDDLKTINQHAQFIIKNYYIPLMVKNYHLPIGQFELFK